VWHFIFREPYGGVIKVIEAVRNGLMRLGRKAFGLVIPDGISTRYPGSIYNKYME